MQIPNTSPVTIIPLHDSYLVSLQQLFIGNLLLWSAGSLILAGSLGIIEGSFQGWVEPSERPPPYQCGVTAIHVHQCGDSCVILCIVAHVQK